MFSNIKDDLPASIGVFFVALPLCLGIALASGAPLFAGIIAGIVGGIIVGSLSASPLGVSGPAAGLAVIVLHGITTLGWPAFLVAVVLAGLIQLAMGYARMGFIAYFFPSSVIKGMLSGIGILIILKQIPHLLGFNGDILGDISYVQFDAYTTFTEIKSAFDSSSPAILLIAGISLMILMLWDSVLVHKHKIFHLIQGPLVVVVVGILINVASRNGLLPFQLEPEHVVMLPVPSDFSAFINQLTFPDFSVVTYLEVWGTALVIAIVASLETLLCVEATDKLDPHKRVTPTNRELVAQGLGNVASGLLGGLPVTQVVIRSSANIDFGAKSKLSAILHGALLLICSLTIAPLLNLIPIASLSAILVIVGYKLAKIDIFKKVFKLGDEQYVPFIATIAGILLTDLLKGICIGLVCGLFFTLRHSYRNAYYMKDVVTQENSHAVHHIVLAEEVSFFNKASIIQALDSIKENAKVIIDCQNSKSIAYDVVEFIKDYKNNAKFRNITVETIGFIEPK